MLYGLVAEVARQRGDAIAVFEVSDKHQPITITYGQLLVLIEYFGTRLCQSLARRKPLVVANNETNETLDTDRNLFHTNGDKHEIAREEPQDVTVSGKSTHDMNTESLAVQPYIFLCGLYGMQLVVATLAVLWAGGVAVPIDPDLPDARRNLIQKQTRASICLTTQEIANRCFGKDGAARSTTSVHNQTHCEIVSLTEILQVLKRDEMVNTETSFQNSGVTDSRLGPVVQKRVKTVLSHVIYTSGSTGVPKGVVCSQAALHKFSTESAKVLGITTTSRVLLTSNPTWDPSVGDIFTALLAGGVLCTTGRAMIVHNLRSAINRTQATHLFCTPSHWALVGARPGDLPSVQALSLGGERIPADMVSTWCKSEVNSKGLRMYNVYGTTEGTVYQTWSELQPDKATNIIGYPISGVHALVIAPQLHLCACSDTVANGEATRVRRSAEGICDTCGGCESSAEVLKDLGTDVVGEIVLGGVQTSEGYHQDPTLTNERYITHGGLRYFRTGDVGLRLPGGELKVLGRSDTQVKLRGRRVDLGDIESVINSSGCVERVAVIVTHHKRNNKNEGSIDQTIGSAGKSAEARNTEREKPSNTPDYGQTEDKSSSQVQRLVAIIVVKEGIMPPNSHQSNGSSDEAGTGYRHQFADWRGCLETALYIHCRSHLPDYQVPANFIDVASMPLLANGKLNRRALTSVAENYGCSARKTSEAIGGNEGDVTTSNASESVSRSVNRAEDARVRHTNNPAHNKPGEAEAVMVEYQHEHSKAVCGVNQAHHDNGNTSTEQSQTAEMEELTSAADDEFLENFLLDDEERDGDYSDTTMKAEHSYSEEPYRHTGKLEGDLEHFVARIWVRVLDLYPRQPHRREPSMQLDGSGRADINDTSTQQLRDELDSQVNLEDHSGGSEHGCVSESKQDDIPVGPLTHFFNNGGDSLRAIQMLQAIRDEIADLGKGEVSTRESTTELGSYTGTSSDAIAQSDLLGNVNGQIQMDAMSSEGVPCRKMQESSMHTKLYTQPNTNSHATGIDQTSTSTSSLVGRPTSANGPSNSSSPSAGTSTNTSTEAQSSSTTHLTMSDETARGLLCGLHKNPRLRDFVVMLRVAMTTAPDVSANYTAGLNFVEIMDREDDNEGIPTQTGSEAYADRVVLRDEGISALCKAARAGCVPIVECLLRTGQVPVDGYTTRTCKRMSPLMLAVMLERSVLPAGAEKRRISLSDKATATNVLCRNTEEVNGNTMETTETYSADNGKGGLNSSVGTKEEDAEVLLKTFLHYGANPWLVNNRGANALHLAAKSGPRSLKVLLRYILDTSSVHHRTRSSVFLNRDQYAWTCLHYAAWGGHVECVQMLLNATEHCDDTSSKCVEPDSGISNAIPREADADTHPSRVHTQLHSRAVSDATEHHHHPKPTIPIESSGSNGTNKCGGTGTSNTGNRSTLLCAKDRWGRTAIAWAVYRNWIPVIEVLATQHRLDKSWNLSPPQLARQRRRNNTQWLSPLHMALQRGVCENDTRALSVLLQNGAPMHLTDNSRRFPLHFACGMVAVAALAKIDQLREHTQECCAVGHGDQDHAITDGRGMNDTSIGTCTSKDTRAHPDSSLDNDTCTCEDVQAASALLQRSARVVQLMLDRPVESEDHIAGYHVDSRDVDGNTALHLAVRSGNVYVAKLLLRSGGKCDILNKHGQSPVEYAREALNRTQNTKASGEHPELPSSRGTRELDDAWPLLDYFVHRSVAVCGKYGEQRKSESQADKYKHSQPSGSSNRGKQPAVEAKAHRTAALRAQYGFVAHGGNVNSSNVCRAYNQQDGCRREWCKFGHFCSTCGFGSSHPQLQCAVITDKS